MNPEYVDLETWSRRAAYQFFKDFEHPFFQITAPLDVTALVSYCKANAHSFTMASLYLAMCVVNDYAPLRLRIEGDRVVRYPIIHPSATELGEDGEKLVVVGFAFSRDFETFCANANAARQEIEGQEVFLSEISKRPDTLHFSSLPWVSFTSVSHAKPGAGHKSSEPKLTFGRFTRREQRLEMPVSLECHHALMDGMHAGKFFERLQALFLDPARTFSST